MEHFNTRLNLKPAWAGKGIAWTTGMWAHWRDDGTPVITVWFSERKGVVDVEFDDMHNPVRMVTPDDSWSLREDCSDAQRRSLKKYNKVCLDARDAKVPAQVIFLIGLRRPEGGISHPDYCVIRRDAYAVQIEYIGDDGVIKGPFISKHDYDQWKKTHGPR